MERVVHALNITQRMKKGGGGGGGTTLAYEENDQ